MKIGIWTLNAMKSQILMDLYNATDDELLARKQSLVLENLEIARNEWAHVLNQLPEEFVSHHSAASLAIKYMKNETGNYKYEDTWSVQLDTPGVVPITLPNPMSLRYYAHSPCPMKLYPTLYKVAAELIEDILEFNAERREMDNFLSETIKNNQGYRQLQKALPDHLHKYIPIPSTAKNPAPKKRSEHDTHHLEIKETLENRLTTNLLEGN